jgi:hypothetical protein
MHRLVLQRQARLIDRKTAFWRANEDIEVQVTFADLTEKDREALGKYTPEGAATFTAWKRLQSDGTDVLSANAKGFPEFNAIKTANGVAAKRSFIPISELVAQSWSFRQPQPVQPLSSNDYLGSITYRTTRRRPRIIADQLFRFQCGKMSGLFDFVLVTADLRASEESIDGKSSIIGRILERSVDRASADEEIAKIVEESRTQQQKCTTRNSKHNLMS